MICPELLKSLQSTYFGAQDDHLRDKTIKSNYDEFHSTFSETDWDEWSEGCKPSHRDRRSPNTTKSKERCALGGFWDKVMKSEKYRKIQCIKKTDNITIKNTKTDYEYQCLQSMVPSNIPDDYEKTIYKFELLPYAGDFIEDINIVIKKQKGVEYKIGQITLDIAGMRIVRLHDTTQLNVLNSVYRQHTVEDKRITEDTITIPCTFTNRIIPLVRLYHHEVRIQCTIAYKKLPESTGLDVELYGNIYILNLPLRRQLCQSQNFFNTTTRIIQNQCTGAEKIKRGTNHIRLNFNHPVFLIYFYGIDQAKINNVQFVVNGETVYDRSIRAQEEPIYRLFDDDKDTSFIYFSKKFNFDDLYNNDTINFSRIEKAVLVIDTDQDDDDATVNIVGLNYGIARTAGGMYGLAFSK